MLSPRGPLNILRLKILVTRICILKYQCKNPWCPAELPNASSAVKIPLRLASWCWVFGQQILGAGSFILLGWFEGKIYENLEAI
jgi:hypothetical protein